MATRLCGKCGGHGYTINYDQTGRVSCTECDSTGQFIEPTRATDGANPKDVAARAKVDLSLVPATALLHLAHAMMDGAKKYDPYNWRSRKVFARVYMAAAMRHIGRFLEGEDVDPESGVHHLGHGMACLAIALDAQETGNLQDDRPPPAPLGAILERLRKTIEERGTHLPREVK